MASPLSGSMAASIYLGLKNIFLDATLIHDVASSNSPDIDAFDIPAPTATSYTCKAIVEMYSEAARAEGFANQSDRRVIILNDSLSVTPVSNDRITIRSATYVIITVEADPALVTWVCKARI